MLLFLIKVHLLLFATLTTFSKVHVYGGIIVVYKAYLLRRAPHRLTSVLILVQSTILLQLKFTCFLHTDQKKIYHLSLAY